LKSQVRKLVAIEVKGGIDISNVWNRLGEAEKSHQTAKTRGFNERWTVLRVDIVSNPAMLKTAQEKSPSTTQFFSLDQILNQDTPQGKRFREVLESQLGVRF
jgi:hypothetical protein